MENRTLFLVGALCLGLTSSQASVFETSVSEGLHMTSAKSPAMKNLRGFPQSPRFPVPAEPAYVAECRVAGYRKLRSQAAAYGVKIDMRTARLDESAENNGNGGFKYLWWAVDVVDINGRVDVFPGPRPVLKKLTQKPGDQPCF